MEDFQGSVRKGIAVLQKWVLYPVDGILFDVMKRGNTKISQLVEITKHPLTVAELRMVLDGLDSHKPIVLKLSAPDAKVGDEYYLPQDSVVNSENEVAFMLAGFNLLANKDDEGKRQLVRNWENRP